MTPSQYPDERKAERRQHTALRINRERRDSDRRTENHGDMGHRRVKLNTLRSHSTADAGRDAKLRDDIGAFIAAISEGVTNAEATEAIMKSARERYFIPTPEAERSVVTEEEIAKTAHDNFFDEPWAALTVGGIERDLWMNVAKAIMSLLRTRAMPGVDREALARWLTEWTKKYVGHGRVLPELPEWLTEDLAEHLEGKK